MRFTKQTHRANTDGSIGLIVPHWVTGPNEEEIEPGDVVTLEVVEVQKQGDEDERT